MSNIINFKTSQGEFAFLKDESILNLENSKEGIYAHYKSGTILPYIKNAEFIGFVKDITENQWKEIVEKVKFTNIHRPGESNLVEYYKDYNNLKDFKTAAKSAESLLNILDVHMKENWILIKYIK